MKKEILLIDDDQDLLRSIQVILEKHDFNVRTATDSQKGYLKLKEQTPDLLVLDVMMDTNLDGYNFLHKIKQEPEFRELPVILLTGMIDQLGVNLYSAVENNSVLPNILFRDKPIDPLLLIELIEEMLSEKKDG